MRTPFFSKVCISVSIIKVSLSENFNGCGMEYWKTGSIKSIVAPFTKLRTHVSLVSSLHFCHLSLIFPALKLSTVFSREKILLTCCSVTAGANSGSLATVTVDSVDSPPPFCMRRTSSLKKTCLYHVGLSCGT